MRTGLIISAVLMAIPFSVRSEPYTCEDLGYVFEEGGCRDTSSMVRCPMNLERVWCIGGEMCGQYPVKGLACNDGADIEYCNLTENMGQLSKRCKYKSDICNDGWHKGELQRITGSTAECCRDGWDLDPATGICKEHVCSSIKYPYNTDDATYADYAGEIETCRSGNKVYFGYKSCYNMWQRESENAGESGYYKCLCKRDDYDNGYVFPFDKSTFYTTFNAGKYGDYHMCADAENSYYGYEHCFRGYEMEKTSGKKNGVCVVYYSTYCNVTSSLTNQPSSGGDPNMEAVINSGYKCVYQTYGTKDCTPENQKYEECSVCFADAARTANGEPYMKLCSLGFNGIRTGYINHCPEDNQIFIGNSVWWGRASDSGGHNPADNDYQGACYRTCEWGSKNCKRYDVVLHNNKIVGIIFSQSGTSYLVMAAVTGGNTFNSSNGWFNAAKAFAETYTPADNACPVGSGCETGKWRLPNSSEANAMMFGTQRAYIISPILGYHSRFVSDVNYVVSNPTFTAHYDSSENVFFQNDWNNGYSSKNSGVTGYVYPVTTMEGK